ncbi:hypothetical protein [Arthrobacter sp. GCM10027362]|uniref:hypothetical protein n=1 Tax=Arthrobacter sp. GCM10027362 TaxID=3273379 RepID=UPI00366CE838
MWKVLGVGWFDGDDAKALEWLRTQAAIEFTDPAKIRWRKYGHGIVEELTPEAAAAAASEQQR